MLSQAQLAELERLAFDTRLRGAALTAEWERREALPTKPLYKHDPEKFRKFFERLYTDIDGGIAGLLPPFEIWLGDACLKLVQP